ncbi:MAG: peptidylprolyl isomerase [Sphingobacteriaceae bacterium]|nr:MAG: peptidylprolyl isomerase [Sphingobacteriaceae bacterium]
MKRFFILLMAIATFASCKKDDNFNAERQAQEDDITIRSYLETNAIDAVKDESGVYYKVVEPGADITPTATSALTVNYKGNILNGPQFDAGTNVKIRLNNTIIGWQKGIPKIKKGGRILLFIPSALGYGRSISEKIPENSILVFDVTLVDVSN